MKKLLSFILAFTIISFSSATVISAQDFCKTDPSFHKVLVDNEFITATEVTFKPGKKTSLHTHPGAFIYALTKGTLLVRYADGGTQTFDLKAGDAAYQAPEKPHMTENTGKKTMKVLLVELKHQPYMANKNMK